MTEQEREALVTALNGLAVEDGKIDDELVVGTIQKKVGPVYQTIFNKGHSEATARAKLDKKTVEDQLQAAKDRADAAETALNEFQQKTPDVKEMTEKHKGDLRTLQLEHEAALNALKESVRGERESRVRSDLQSQLIASGVDPDYAEVLVSKEGTRKRLKLDDEGALEILQAGKDIPIAADDPLKAFAEELRKAVPAKFVRVDGDGGAGLDGGSGGAGGGSFYDQHKTSLEQSRKEARDRKKKTGAERLGVISAS